MPLKDASATKHKFRRMAMGALFACIAVLAQQSPDRRMSTSIPRRRCVFKTQAYTQPAVVQTLGTPQWDRVLCL